MAKVYVSSTIADLKPERAAVLDWLRLARHQAVDSYLPDSDTVRGSCLDDVGTCDLYVLILGHRYGFQPPDDNPEGLSITQLEFRRAGECGIPRVALVRTSVPDVRLSDVEDPARVPLVLAFRVEVAGQVRAAEFSDLQGLILGLSTGIQGALDKPDERERRQAGQVMAGPALRLAPRPVFLAGRDELLAELDARLAGDDDAGPRLVALCGLGGAGKTSVALEYAYRQLGAVRVAWQFSAEDPAVLAAGFGELAVQLGAGDSGDPVASVHRVLAASPAPWLLIFDNAPDRASVAGFLPPAGPGRLLITSRNQIWPPGQALEVPVLGARVAADFLVDRTGDQDRQAALELADKLGGLPLALEQAAAYVQASGGSLAGYLASFRQRRPEMLVRGQATGYGSTVAATWSLAFGRLCQSAPEASGLLRLLACCAPEAIPVRLLLQPRPALAGLFGGEVVVLKRLLEDPLAAGDAIAGLRQYSLVTSAAGGSVLVHRLVQNVMLDQMPAELAGHWQQAAAALIEAAIPDDPELPETWPVCAALLPHAQAALDRTSDGMWRIARYLGESGSYPAARDLFGLIADAYRVDGAYGAEHPCTLAARGNLARWTGEAGDPAAARDLDAELVPAYERVLGPEHPDTLAARSNLARWAGIAGDPAAARDLLAELVPAYERVLGPEHPDTLTARHELAYWTGAAGDPAAAWDLDAALLPVRERVLRRANPGAVTASGMARDPAARGLYAELAPVTERVPGPQSRTTLINRANLASQSGRKGDPAAARDRFAELVPVYERVLGPEHPDTLTARGNLARWTGIAGNPGAACDLYAELVPFYEGAFGPQHQITLINRAILASWTGHAGDPAAARGLYAELVPMCERALGPQHRTTQNARHELAYWTEQAARG